MRRLLLLRLRKINCRALGFAKVFDTARSDSEQPAQAQIRARERALQQQGMRTLVHVAAAAFVVAARADGAPPPRDTRLAPLKPRSPLSREASCSSHCPCGLTLSLADCYTHLERDGFPCDDGDPQTTEDQVSVSGCASGPTRMTSQRCRELSSELLSAVRPCANGSAARAPSATAACAAGGGACRR